MAICGGVNCVMQPSMMMPLSKARMVSPTGASRAFSADADGYARGEGGGVVILKRLSDVSVSTSIDFVESSPFQASHGIQTVIIYRVDGISMKLRI